MNNIYMDHGRHVYTTQVCAYINSCRKPREKTRFQEPQREGGRRKLESRESEVPHTALALSRCWSVSLSVSLSLTPPHTITPPRKGENGGWAEKRGDVMTRWLSHPSPLAPTSWPSHGCPAAWSASRPATTLPPRPASPPAALGPHSAHSSGEPSRTLCSSSGPRLYSAGTVGLSASVLLICPSGH